MKRILILLVLVGLLMAPVGCASFKSFVDSAQGLVCNPSDQVKAEARLAIQLIQAALNMANIIPGSPAFLALVDAKIVFTTVAGGACVALTELQKALATLDQQVQAPKAAGGIPIETFPALHAYAKR